MSEVGGERLVERVGAWCLTPNTHPQIPNPRSNRAHSKRTDHAKRSTIEESELGSNPTTATRRVRQTLHRGPSDGKALQKITYSSGRGRNKNPHQPRELVVDKRVKVRIVALAESKSKDTVHLERCHRGEG